MESELASSSLTDWVNDTVDTELEFSESPAANPTPPTLLAPWV